MLGPETQEQADADADARRLSRFHISTPGSDSAFTSTYTSALFTSTPSRSEESNLRARLKNMEKELQAAEQDNVKLEKDLEAEKEKSVELETELAQWKKCGVWGTLMDDNMLDGME